MAIVMCEQMRNEAVANPGLVSFPFYSESFHEHSIEFVYCFSVPGCLQWSLSLALCSGGRELHPHKLPAREWIERQCYHLLRYTSLSNPLVLSSNACTCPQAFQMHVHVLRLSRCMYMSSGFPYIMSCPQASVHHVMSSGFPYIMSCPQGGSLRLH